MAGNPNWKPGVSGNPNGRPKKGETLTDLLGEKLDKDKFVRRLISLAWKGDMTAIKYIYDRIDGAIPQKSQIEAEVKQDVKFNINPYPNGN